MFTITFDGVEYTKASEVAKEFGYTADYIGQLCRAKKIDARLVGRTWFVNTTTLHEHKQIRYKKLQNLAGEGKTELVTREIEGAEAEPVIVKKTGLASKKYLRRVTSPTARWHKIIEQTDRLTGEVNHVSLRYEPDDNSLIPTVRATPKVTLLRVDMADSETVLVKSDSKPSVLKPDALPDVALSGKLAISEISDEDYSNNPEELVADTNKESNAVTTEKIEEAGNIKSVSRDNVKNKLRIRAVQERKVSDKTQEPTLGLSKENSESESPSKMMAKSPQVVAMTRKNSVKTPTEPHSEEIPVASLNNVVAEQVSIEVRVPALGLALGIAVAALLLTAEQVAFVTSGSTGFAIRFDWSNVSNMALVLFTG